MHAATNHAGGLVAETAIAADRKRRPAPARCGTSSRQPQPGQRGRLPREGRQVEAKHFGRARRLTGKGQRPPAIGRLLWRKPDSGTLKLQMYHKGFETSGAHPPKPVFIGKSHLHPGPDTDVTPRQPGTGLQPDSLGACQQHGRQPLRERRRHGAGDDMLHKRARRSAAGTLQTRLIGPVTIKIAQLDNGHHCFATLPHKTVATGRAILAARVSVRRR